MLQLYFLLVLFVGFIIYGLANSLLGTAWPLLSTDVGVDIGFLGVVNVFSFVASGLSSANAYRVRKLIGNNFSIIIGMLFFAIGIISFRLVNSQFALIIPVVLLGLGYGLVDAISNNYVVKYHKAKDVSYLHACWGIGSSIGPMMISTSIISTGSYKKSFSLALLIILIMVVILIFTKIFWENKKKSLDKETVLKYTISDEEKTSKTTLRDIFKIKYAVYALLCFLLGNGINGTLNSWLPSIFSERGVAAADAAKCATCFFLGLTAIRILIGFVSNKIKNSMIITTALIVTGIGILMLFINTNNTMLAYAICVVLGVGIGPLIPFLNYNMKELFGENDLALLISGTNVCGQVGVAVSSFLITILVGFTNINCVQVMLLVFFILELCIYRYLVSKREQKKV